MLRVGLSFLVLLSTLGRCMASPTQVVMADPAHTLGAPSVRLDSATVVGISSEHVNRFLGIPFAQPPTGNLRFQLPQQLPSYTRDFVATKYGDSCPQHEQAPPNPIRDCMGLGGSNLFNWKNYGSESEDCLTLNVVTPINASPESKLPVVVWIFGGGFVFGGTDAYNASSELLVKRSVTLGVPAIYVSMNYRVNAFGFLPGKEVKEAGVGNLGLHDQRLALRWVQKYISAFGGDPKKVTIWGESAGAISVGLQMVTNGGNHEGLFQAAFMQSGAPIPVGDITNGQKYFDALVDETGCDGAKDKLECLRQVPFKTLMDAVNKSPGISSYQSLALAWMPRVDGKFLTENPMKSVHDGSIAKVPFVSGNVDDEGTLFSFSNSNITNDDQMKEYLKTYWLPGAPDDVIAEVMQAYPNDPKKGSPFNTGDKNQYKEGQFKRLAAFQGDAVFQAPRRYLIQELSARQNVWTFVSTRLKGLKFCGAFHASDLALNIMWGGDMLNYLLRFVTNLDPNGEEMEEKYWPAYHSGAQSDKHMLEFADNLFQRQKVVTDTYRVHEMKMLTEILLEHPL